jgi:hypothetical protein
LVLLRQAQHKFGCSSVLSLYLVGFLGFSFVFRFGFEFNFLGCRRWRSASFFLPLFLFAPPLAGVLFLLSFLYLVGSMTFEFGSRFDFEFDFLSCRLWRSAFFLCLFFLFDFF